MTYDVVLTRAEQERFSAWPRDKARRFALELLVAWVAATFPDLRKST